MAEVLGISATGFVLHCPCAVDPSDESLETNGVLQITRQNSRFYSAVLFPKSGDKVCSFSLVYRDVNGKDAIRAVSSRRRSPPAGRRSTSRS